RGPTCGAAAPPVAVAVRPGVARVHNAQAGRNYPPQVLQVVSMRDETACRYSERADDITEVKCMAWSAQTKGNGGISTARDLSSECLPSTIACTMSGAKNVIRRIRLT